MLANNMPAHALVLGVCGVLLFVDFGSGLRALSVQTHSVSEQPDSTDCELCFALPVEDRKPALFLFLRGDAVAEREIGFCLLLKTCDVLLLLWPG